ncbi:hypothetical protein AMAG_01398 [Allomyces macrogynus ATCC 38327]|uniref:Uncharacterized protein n=1 Tax=Allomyces macrogynus (strain ATCC 38327) TaxID=578462 RepID=A0A0L0RZE8_ALLM3|nr:hypothetical protein AMAG_01398 [Allomyces macrogynus ATCC 38327]|eukprot:KNE55510.1 hypothetical protein AMAG_01398 [Allomyces macrogynus ATCC 38327]
MHAKLLAAETPVPKPEAKHALRRADKSPLHWAATKENCEEWGHASGLTLDQYFEREQVLQLTTFAQGAHTSWVMAPVFVDHAKRGHGYATHLVTMIRDHWITQRPDLGVSVLY